MSDLPEVLKKNLVQHILANRHAQHDLACSEIRYEGHDWPASSDDDPSTSDPFWMGRYIPMGNSGHIILHRENISKNFWFCINNLGKKIGINSSEEQALCESLVFMVLFHERFHHWCNVTRHAVLPLSPRNQQEKENEEALATAWEWQELQRSFTPFKSLNQKIQNAWLEWWFDDIRSPGYKDWKNHAHSCLFKSGLVDYLFTSISNTVNYTTIQQYYEQLIQTFWQDNEASYAYATINNENPGEPFEIDQNDMLLLAIDLLDPWVQPTNQMHFCNKKSISRHDIHKNAQKGFQNKVVCIANTPIREAVLVFFLISGVEKINSTGLTGKLKKACDIINSFLPSGKVSLLDCHDALIDNGLDDFANLR